MSKLTKESKVKELYGTAIGRDLLDKLLLTIGKSDKLILNPIVGNLKLKTLDRIIASGKQQPIMDSLLRLINSEEASMQPIDSTIKEAWWKDAVFYQIYPRSFYDTNKDGIGDLKGIIAKLEYLKELGVDCIWLSPIYDSPNDDNGYDIRDYKKIMAEFGTMEDFDVLLDRVHSLGMRLIMDLVVNHTSDEHEWFIKALGGDPKYHDYYIFRSGNPDKAPNNYLSFFAGSAWNYYPNNKEWGLHLFSKKQMDLNWDNPNLRADVADMVSWWLDKGVDGFRMDVINCISKVDGLPDGNETIGQMVGIRGIENYFYGPNLHKYLKELCDSTFKKYNAFSVGETPGLGMQMARLTTGDERGELNMVFSFDHLETPGHTRFEDYEYDLNYLRDYMIKWMTQYGNNCRMSLFYNNHDNPRMCSKVTSDIKLQSKVQVLLAIMQFTLNGTPFIYQGDEMGLKNYHFSSMNEITDVEAKGYYAEYIKSKSPEEAFSIIHSGTREHARILLPWNEDALDRPHLVSQQRIDENITELYRRLINLRKNSHTLKYGSFEVLNRKKDRFVYLRKDVKTDVNKECMDNEYLIDINLGKKRVKAYTHTGYENLIPAEYTTDKYLEPYEARIYVKRYNML